MKIKNKYKRNLEKRTIILRVVNIRKIQVGFFDGIKVLTKDRKII